MEQKQIEVYILGNTRRFVVQTLIRVLQESNLKTTLIDMDSRQINNMPGQRLDSTRGETNMVL